MTDKEKLTALLMAGAVDCLGKGGALNCSKLADYLLEHGVIVLPCKLLSKCVVLPTTDNNLPDITEMKCLGFSLSADSYNANLVTEKNKLYQPCFGAFGKTVFLTREEAEKALKECER